MNYQWYVFMFIAVCCPPEAVFPLGCTIAAESPICQQGGKYSCRESHGI
jgi:hypothetical protein